MTGCDAAAEAERLRALARDCTQTYEDERRRIARILHDGPGQALSALAMQLDWIAAQETDPELATRLRRLVAVAGDTLSELNRVCHDLRPASLDRLGLEAALRELSGRASSPALVIELAPAGARRLPAAIPSAVATTAYRLTEAALAHIIGQTRARRAVISLAGEVGALELDIEADGAIRDAAAAARDPKRIGMEERAAWSGGTLAVEAAPGGGTRIRLRIPLPAEAPEGGR